MLTTLGEQSRETEAAGLLQQVPCLPSTLPHIMVMISTTFESPKAKNCSHITEPAVKLSLIYHKLFQTGSKFFKKTQHTKEVQGEKVINLAPSHSKKPNISIIILSTCIPKGWFCTS